MAADYYRTLGVERKADEKEIKSAYRRLARKHHPDINPGDKASEAKFKEINEAYQVLGDADKRKLYDSYGHNWEAASKFGGGAGAGGGRVNFDFGNVGNLTDFGSLFESLFNKAGRATPRPQPGEDLEQMVAVSFLESYQGATRTIQFAVVEACPPCQGTGEQREKKCGKCQGVGTARIAKQLEVKIPAGVRNAQRIRLSGQGGGGALGVRRGDLFLVVRVTPHPFFNREGDDLLCELPISYPEAVLGAEITIPTVTGEVKMKIPPGTQSGQLFKLNGKGMPRGGGGFGDERVRVRITAPKDPSRREVELIKELAALRKDNPRDGLLT